MTSVPSSAPDEQFRQIRALRGLVVALLGEEHAADDVLQDVWLASQTKQPTRGASTWSWLRGLARIEALRRRRAEQRRRARERAAARPEVDPAASNERAAERIALAQSVLEELRALPEPEARLLWSHYFDERTAAELARESGVSAEAMRVRLFRARNRLRARLERRFGRRSEWRSAIAPLASGPSAILATDAAAKTAGTLFAALAGGLTMKAKVMSCGALLLALGAASWLAWPARLRETPGTTIAGTAAAKATDGGEIAGSSELAFVVREPTSGTASATPTERSEARGPGILVVDGSGAPRSGVPVQVVHRAPRGRYRGEVLWSGSTAADGFARFPSDLAASCERIEEREAEIAATFAFPQAEPIEHTWRGTEIPLPQIELRLPETGSAEIRCIDEEGRAPGHDISVMLRAGSRAALEADPLLWEALSSQMLTTANGRVSLPFVGLGCALEVKPFWPSVERIETWQRFTGPVRAEEHLVLECLPGPRSPFLQGRLIGPDGEPVRTSDFSVGIREGAGGGQLGASDGSRTDAEGRFRFNPWRYRAPGLSGALKIEFTVRALGDARASIERELPLPVGPVDLGDLRLIAIPIIAAGVVRDAEGQPVPLAPVSAELYTQRAGTYEEMLSVVTDESGAFTLRAATERKRLAICTFLDGRQAALVTGLTPGSAEALALELRLPPRSGIAGTVLLDEGLSASSLRVHAIGADGYRRHCELRRKDLSFELPLPAGRYRLLVDASGRELWKHQESIERNGIVLFEVDELVVEERGLTRDPRLQAIDLRGRVRTLRARLIDERGEPLRRAALRFAPLDAGVTSECYVARSDAEGNVELLCAREHERFLLAAPGFRPQPCSWQADPQTLQVSRGQTLVVRLRNGAPRPAAAMEIFAELWPIELPSDELRRAVGREPVGTVELAGGRATLQAPCPGIYELRWFLQLRNGERIVRGEARPALEARVQLSAGANDPELELAFDAAELEAAQLELTRDR
jgi:RNA polymerase sigma-70 factor (ECF subfamily)